MRETALVEGRKIFADHELETQFITQRKEKEEQERKDEREKLAATQVEIEQIPIPEDVDVEDGHGGKKRRGFQLKPCRMRKLKLPFCFLWMPWVRRRLC